MSAYDELYLADAMAELACFFDFAVNDYGAEGSEVAELFAMSGVGREFGHGNPRVLGGLSGVELFWELSHELGYGDARGRSLASALRRRPTTGRVARAPSGSLA